MKRSRTFDRVYSPILGKKHKAITRLLVNSEILLKRRASKQRSTIEQPKKQRFVVEANFKILVKSNSCKAFAESRRMLIVSGESRQCQWLPPARNYLNQRTWQPSTRGNREKYNKPCRVQTNVGKRIKICNASVGEAGSKKRSHLDGQNRWREQRRNREK